MTDRLTCSRYTTTIRKAVNAISIHGKIVCIRYWLLEAGPNYFGNVYRFTLVTHTSPLGERKSTNVPRQRSLSQTLTFGGENTKRCVAPPKEEVQSTNVIKPIEITDREIKTCFHFLKNNSNFSSKKMNSLAIDFLCSCSNKVTHICKAFKKNQNGYNGIYKSLCLVGCSKCCLLKEKDKSYYELVSSNFTFDNSEAKKRAIASTTKGPECGKTAIDFEMYELDEINIEQEKELMKSLLPFGVCLLVYSFSNFYERLALRRCSRLWNDMFFRQELNIQIPIYNLFFGYAFSTEGLLSVNTKYDKYHTRFLTWMAEYATCIFGPKKYTEYNAEETKKEFESLVKMPVNEKDVVPDCVTKVITFSDCYRITQSKYLSCAVNKPDIHYPNISTASSSSRTYPFDGVEKFYFLYRTYHECWTKILDKGDEGKDVFYSVERFEGNQRFNIPHDAYIVYHTRKIISSENVMTTREMEILKQTLCPGDWPELNFDQRHRKKLVDDGYISGIDNNVSTIPYGKNKLIVVFPKKRSLKVSEYSDYLPYFKNVNFVASLLNNKKLQFSLLGMSNEEYFCRGFVRAMERLVDAPIKIYGFEEKLRMSTCRKILKVKVSPLICRLKKAIEINKNLRVENLEKKSDIEYKSSFISVIKLIEEMYNENDDLSEEDFQGMVERLTKAGYLDILKLVEKKYNEDKVSEQEIQEMTEKLLRAHCL